MNRCILGRETGIQKVVWDNEGWLRLEDGGNSPKVEVTAPQLAQSQSLLEPVGRIELDHFDLPVLDINFNSLRTPVDESWCSLREKPGFLRLYGRESLSSQYHQSLIARRIQSYHVEVETCLEFSPETFQQLAGLVFFYDTDNYVYLRLTHDENLGICLGIDSCDRGEFESLLEDLPLKKLDRVYLKGLMNEARLDFTYSSDGQQWIPIGHSYDSSKLSDDYVSEMAFTGAFVGLCVQDLTGRRCVADFDYFRYSEIGD